MEPKTAYRVRTGNFEGPLELLLELIEKHRLHINEVSLSTVADDFIEYVKRLEHFPVAESANFVLIASTLLLIKSRSLLPSLPLTAEEEGNIRALELRLKIYQRIKNASAHVKEKFGRSILFDPEERKREAVFSPDRETTLAGLSAAVREVLASFPKKDFLPKAVVEKVISLEEMIGRLGERIGRELRMTFREFSQAHQASRVHLIVGFLAMLELVKQGVITVTQEARFGDIMMETEEVGTPRYG